jgi:hypothetical protein
MLNACYLLNQNSPTTAKNTLFKWDFDWDHNKHLLNVGKLHWDFTDFTVRIHSFSKDKNICYIVLKMYFYINSSAWIE